MSWSSTTCRCQRRTELIVRPSDGVWLFHVSEQADICVFHPRLFDTAPDAGPSSGR